MEAENADDADDWIIAIRSHIQCANSIATQEEPETAESYKARAAKAQSMRVDKSFIR
jgi:hypothetical protein